MGLSDLRHRLIAEVKEIASALGKTPTRDEYRQHSKIGEKAYRSAFNGSYSILLQAAGLRKTIDAFNPNDIFKAEVQHRSVPKTTAPVSQDNPTQAMVKRLGKSKTLILGDTHFPWVSVEALSAVYQFIENNPDITTVIQMGDLYDMFSWAKFPRTHLLYNPQQEIEIGRKMAEDMWTTIQRMLPGVRCVQILGNHDIRPIKKCLELAPELEPFLQFKHLFKFENVELIDDPRQPFELDGVWYMHGHLSGLGAHARKYLRSVVCGHTHRGGCVMIPMGENGMVGSEGPKTLFECNAGLLGDPQSRPMSYTPTKINEWTLGFAVIDEWGPRFVPL